MVAEVYEAQQHERKVAVLKCKAAKLDFTMVQPAAELAA
jgi:hypothetical protein